MASGLQSLDGRTRVEHFMYDLPMPCLTHEQHIYVSEKQMVPVWLSILAFCLHAVSPEN